MRKRTPAEVGALIRRRRLSLGLTQDGIHGVSSATVRKLEGGHEGPWRPATTIALTRALRWPDDALDLLADGADPAELEEPGVMVMSEVERAIADDDALSEDARGYLLVLYREAARRGRGR